MAMSVGWTHVTASLLYVVFNSVAPVVRGAEHSQGLRVVIRDRKEGKGSDVRKSQNGNDTCFPTLTPFCSRS